MSEENADPKDDQKAPAKPKGKAPEPAETSVPEPAATPVPEPAWLADPDYTGPLTCDQASRRLARHGHHVTKPEEGPVKK